MNRDVAGDNSSSLDPDDFASKGERKKLLFLGSSGSNV